MSENFINIAEIRGKPWLNSGSSSRIVLLMKRFLFVGSFNNESIHRMERLCEFPFSVFMIESSIELQSIKS